MRHVILSICLLLSPMAVASQCLTNVEVTGVIDGDTLRAAIVGLPDPLRNVSIRIMGVDTPERRSKCPNEKTLAELAKVFVKEQFLKTKSICIKNVSWDKYGGRILAEVYFDDRNLSDLLLENNLAVPYNGERKWFDWCSFNQKP